MTQPRGGGGGGGRLSEQNGKQRHMARQKQTDKQPRKRERCANRRHPRGERKDAHDYRAKGIPHMTWGTMGMGEANITYESNDER